MDHTLLSHDYVGSIILFYFSIYLENIKWVADYLQTGRSTQKAIILHILLKNIYKRIYST